MSILLYETLDNVAISYDSFSKTDDIMISEASAEQNIDPNSLMVDIEAIHAMPHATRNYTRYTEKCLKNSVPFWTKPYNRPLIKHHNEKNGDIIGRVIDASYKTKDTLSNTPALVLTVNIPGEQAKADVKNGINQTVSIGVIAEDIRCSICGKPIELDSNGEVISCEHRKGHVYGKETAFWDIYSMEPKEISYVIVPSDMFASNIKSYPAVKNKPPRVSESHEEEGKINDMEIQEMESKLKAAEERASNLEAGFKALTESKQSLELQIKETAERAEAAVQKLNVTEAANTELVKKIETLEAANVELNNKISDLTNVKSDLESKAAEELKMREGLETELTSTKIALKESLIDTLQALRKVSGKVELDRETLKNREESSIRDSIADIKIEMQESVTPKIPGSVPNPTLAEEVDNNNDNAIKENKDSNVDLKAGLETIFMALAGARR